MRDTKHDYAAIARFREALRSFESGVDEAVRAAGLTRQRYFLLLMTKGAPDGSERATINELAERLQVEPHTVTGAAARAEEAGLVVRESCAIDRRRTWITLTAEGERKLDEALSALERQRDALLGTLHGAVSDAQAIRPRGARDG